MVDSNKISGQSVLSTCLFLFLFISPGFCQTLDWVKGIYGAGSDYGSSMAIDQQQNVYTTGYVDDTTDFDPGPGVYNLTPGGATDIFIQKLDSAGNFQWARVFGGTSLTADLGFGITTAANGDVYVTGTFYGSGDFDPGNSVYTLTTAGGFDIFIIRFDAAGNFIWARSIGGSQNDRGMDIAIDPSGNIWVTGEFNTSVDFNPGPGSFLLTSAGSNDAFILKLDSAGNFLWAGKCGGSSFDLGNEIGFDSDDNVYVTGTFSGTADLDPGSTTLNITSNGGWDFFILKLDSNGAFVWVKTFGGTGSEYAVSVELSLTNSIYLTGRFEATADFDPGPGNMPLTAVGGADIYLLKLDSSGSYQWAVSMGGSSLDQGYDICTDPADAVFLIGTFNGSVDFDASAGSALVTSNGQGDICLVKYTGNGSFVWAGTVGGIFSEQAGEVQWVQGEKLYFNGFYNGTADFEPGPGLNQLTSASSDDPFSAKLDVSSLTSGLIQESLAGFTIYPVPATELIQISLPSAASFEIKIYNQEGRLIRESMSEMKQTTTIDISELHSGIYFIYLISENNYLADKIIKL